MKRFYKVLLLAHFVLPVAAHAYDDKVHKEINRVAAEQNGGLAQGVDIDQLLKDAQWASSGLQQNLNQRSISEWVWVIGGPGEDAPFWRCANHFYDPLSGALGGLWGYFRTAADWATNDHVGSWYIYTPVQSGTGSRSFFYDGDYSWQAAQHNYFVGLTGYDWVWNGASYDLNRVAATAAEREPYLAHAFRSLGQVMHLVSDMASPAHTRNDGHPFKFVPRWPLLLGPISLLASDAYEKWSEGHTGFFSAGAGGKPVVTPESLSWSRPGAEVRADVPEFFSNYTSYNDLLVGQAPGLADFTSMNFVSQDTVFAEGRPPYPNPAVGRLTRLTGTPYWSYRISTGDTVQHFVRDNFLARTYRLFGVNVPTAKSVELDDTCYQDYAQVLGPEAVRYSAGILRRFFAYELVPRVVALGNQTRVDYRIIEAGSRSPQNPEGTLAQDVWAARVYAYGVTGAQGVSQWVGGTEAESPAGTLWLLEGECFDEIRLVFDGLIQGREYVIGASAKAQLHIVPQPGKSVLEGFSVSLVQPHRASCIAPGAVTGLAASGTLRVSAVLDGGIELPLGESTWPDWSSGQNPLTYFKRYRVDFQGNLGTAQHVPLTAYYDEIVQDGFLVASTDPWGWGNGPRTDSQGDSGTLTWSTWRDQVDLGDQWLRGSWEYTADNLAHRWTVQQTMENGALRSQYVDEIEPTLYQGVEWPDCRDDDVTWSLSRQSGGWSNLLPSIRAASTVQVDATAADPQSAQVVVVIPLYDEPSGTSIYPEFTVPITGPHVVRLGDQRPDLFAAGQTYSVSGDITIRFRACETKSEEYPAGSGVQVNVHYERDVSLAGVKIFP